MTICNVLIKKKYLLLFILLIPLCWLFPYTGDDWAWGSHIGVDRLIAHFEGYNGRYLGNIIVLVLTRSRILRSITMSMTYVVIIKCISSISRSKYSFFTACLLLGLTPKLVFRQAIVWTAGFSNYVISAALVLLLLTFSTQKNINIDEHKKLYSLGMLMLGFSNSLMVEHITLYQIAIGIILLLNAILYKKNTVTPLAFFLTGAIAGAIIMFSNSAYHTIVEGNEGHRTFADGGIVGRAIENYFTSIYSDGFFGNLILNISFLIIALLVFNHIVEKNILSQQRRRAMMTLLILYSVSVIYNLLAKTLFIYSETPKAFIILNGLVAFAELCFLMAYSLLAATAFNDFFRVSVIIASIFMIMAPLFLVTPIGTRCFFCTYLLFVLLLCIFIEYLGENDDSRIIRVAMTTGCISILFVYLVIFSTIEIANAKRLEIVRQAANNHESTVEFVKLPFCSLLWTSAPEGDIWEERYKLFYDIPEELHILVKEREILE